MNEGSAPPADGDSALAHHPHVHWQPPWSASAAGATPIATADRPRRIVSLVPSLSEALCALGLADRLVGVTRYCVHPERAFEGLTRVGGTKDADVAAIAALAPDLVIANQEENTPRIVRGLAERGIHVWVTRPQTVGEGAALLAELATLGAPRDRIAEIVDPVRAAVEQAEARRASQPAARGGPGVFCPIWRDPWMTIGADTYVHDMIELCGGRNLFAGPNAPTTAAARAVAGDRRYPIVELEEVERRRPEVILLPDEPYAFAESDRRELGTLDVPAARDGRIHLIDGTLVSWYGPRIAEAIRVLASIFAGS